MINVEFFVNNELIDIVQVVGFPFKLIKTILGQGQLDSRGGTRSYSCELPSTVNNLRILRLNTELNNNQKFYSTLSYDLIINIDSQRFFTGKLYIQSYNKTSISCYFISNNIDWSNLLQGKNLKDLENFEFEFKGMQTVLANQQAQLADPNAHFFNNYVCFPLVAYGVYFIPYWPKFTKYIDCSNYDGLTNDPLITVDGFPITNSEISHLEFENIPPAYYVIHVLRKIYESIGWSIAGSWLSSIENLIMPTTGLDYVNYNWGFLVDVQISDVNIPLSTAVSDVLIGPYNYTYPIRRIRENNGNIIDTAFNIANPWIYGTFTVPEDGIYEFSYQIDGYQEYGGVSIDYALPIFGWFFINDDFEDNIVESETSLGSGWRRLNLFDSAKLVDLDGVPQYDEIISPFLQPSPIQHPYSINRTFRTELKKFDKIRFINLSRFSLGAVQNWPAANIQTSIKNISGDQLFQIGKNLPDMSQIDFIKGLITLDNVFFTTDDENKIIYFEKQSNFYLNNQNAIDLTELCDVNLATISPNELPNTYKFNFAEDSNDYFIPTAEIIEITPIYQTQKGVQNIECKFSATARTQIQAVVNKDYPFTTLPNYLAPEFSRITTIELPIITNEEQWNSPQYDQDGGLKYANWQYDFNARLLRTGYVADFGSVAPNYRVWNYSTNQEGIEKPSIIPTVFFNETLVDKYENFILLLQLSHTITINVVVNQLIWSKLQANVPVKIDGSFYLIQSIGEFNILKEKDIIELQLLKW